MEARAAAPVSLNLVSVTPIALPTLVSSTSATTQPPAGFSGYPHSNTEVKYLYNSTDRYLQITVTNLNPAIASPRPDPSTVGGYQLFIETPATVSRDFYRFKASLTVVSTGTANSHVRAFLEQAKQDGGASTNELPAEALGDTARRTIQTLSHELIKGSVDLATNRAIVSSKPCLEVSNLQPGETVVLRIHSLSFESADLPGAMIAPLSATQKLAQGQTAKFSVNVIPKGLQGSYQGHLALYPGTTTVNAPVTWSRSFSLLAGAPPTVHPWQAGVGLTEARYTVRYRLVPQGATKGVKFYASAPGVTEYNDPTNGYSYSIGSLVIDNAKGGMHVGMSTHHYPYYHASGVEVNGEATLGALSRTGAAFRINRTLSTELYRPWWTANGSGQLVFDPAVSVDRPNTLPEPKLTFQRWADFFSPPVQAPQVRTKNLVVNLTGTPLALSSDPANANNGFYLPGWSSPLTSSGVSVFADALVQTLTMYKDRVFALECWNEAHSREFWAGSSTQMADACQQVYDIRRYFFPNDKIPVICPQADSPERLGHILSAKTRTGRPITDFCDWVGAHLYNGMGNDPSGQPYGTQSLSEQLRLIKLRMNAYGVANKPLVITEYGIGRAPGYNPPAFNRLPVEQLSDTLKAQVMTQAIATFAEEAVSSLVLYSYDSSSNFLLTVNSASQTPDGRDTINFNTSVVGAIDQASRAYAPKSAPW